jgi:hypothetical protein
VEQMTRVHPQNHLNVGYGHTKAANKHEVRGQGAVGGYDTDMGAGHLACPLGWGWHLVDLMWLGRGGCGLQAQSLTPHVYV